MRINKKGDLPKWFDINNYLGLSSLTDAELFEQLYYRYQLVTAIDFIDWDCSKKRIANGVVMPEIDNDIESLSQQVDRDMLEFTKETLPSQGGVSPMNVGDINRFKLEIDEFNENIKSDNLFLRVLKRGKSINLLDVNDYENEHIYNKIDLTWPDEMIISDLALLLPQWREILGVTVNNEPLNATWEVVRRKVIDYSILPMMDLKLWEAKEGNKITNGVLAVTLFPEGDYDSVQIAQTIKPFLEKLFSYFSMEKLTRDFSQRGYELKI